MITCMDRYRVDVGAIGAVLGLGVDGEGEGEGDVCCKAAWA